MSASLRTTPFDQRFTLREIDFSLVQLGEELSDLHNVRFDALNMSLQGGVLSAEAAAFADYLLREGQLDASKLRKSSIAKLRTAMEAFLADLLLAYASGCWSSRHLNTHGFYGERVNWTSFSRVRKSLADSGFLQETAGSRFGATSETGKRLARQMTCFAPTPKLLMELDQSGIVRSELAQHFSGVRTIDLTSNRPCLRPNKPIAFRVQYE